MNFQYSYLYDVGNWYDVSSFYSTGESLMEIELRNVGIIRSAHLQFVQGLNLIVGASSSGKSTLLRAIRSMMDNSFSDSNISYGQRKLAIRMQYNDHSATYIRDLDNSSRKSAYQIDGKVYTKLGRTSLEDLSNLFKLAPVEIDGEKINFNFSAQFSGPFLLLGSASLLYSILTYRSSFDITKINDLYFSDFKNTKKELDATIKTKKTLEKEKDKKEAELNKLASVPDLYTKIQILKNKNEEYKHISNLYSLYKSSILLSKQKKQKLELLKDILKKYEVYNTCYLEYAILREYKSAKKESRKIERFLKKNDRIYNKLLSVINEYSLVMGLRNYIDSRASLDISKKRIILLNKVSSSLLSIMSKYTIVNVLYSYKEACTKKLNVFNIINNIQKAHGDIEIFLSEYPRLLVLRNYLSSHVSLNKLQQSINKISSVCDKTEDVKKIYHIISLLSLYNKSKEKVFHNRSILNSINIMDTKNLVILQQYLLKLKESNITKEEISRVRNTLNSVLESIKEVGICPLCKQSLCDCK